MTTTSGADESRGASITIDQLIVLTDELRALVEAGIPLELGLRGSASRIGGRLGRIAEGLAARVENGESLVDALAAHQDAIPATYRALMMTGLQTGRLADVLDHISQFAVSMRDLRSQIVRALVYPASVFIIAYGLFVGMVGYFTPWLRESYRAFDIEESRFLWLMDALHQTIWLWAPGIPIAVVSVAILMSRLGISRFVPGIHQVVRRAQLARFAYALAVLTECRTPLPIALRLSAEGTGSARLIRSAGCVAQGLEAGHSLDDSLAGATDLPGLLRWFMSIGQQQSRLPTTLRQAAHVYRQQAAILAGWIQQVVPTVLVLSFGGTVCLVYATALFVPMTTLWKNIVH